MTASASTIEFPHDVKELLSFALGNAPRRAPDQTIQNTAKFLTDTLGCALAGSGSTTNAALYKSFEKNVGNYAIPGRIQKLSRDSAALLTAHAVHCLEWDAVHEPAVVHAMSVTTGALWAELQDNKSTTGRELLECIIVGVEIASRLGTATSAPLRFFRPATAGLLGATAAICRMRRMDLAITAHAIGLAYSQVQGTMQAHVEGSSALAIQVALSARAALNACDMAIAGLTGPHDILSGSFGYYTLIEDGGNTEQLLDGLGERFSIDELSIKPYPTGRASHGALSVLIKHLNTGKVTASSFAGLTAKVPPLVHRLVGRPYKAEMTEAYARLCLPYLVGLALEDGKINPQRFTSKDFTASKIAMFAEKVSVAINENPDLNALAPQHITITLTDGQTISEAVPATLGAPGNPLSVSDLKQKFTLAASISQAKTQNPDQTFDSLLTIAEAPTAFDVLQQLVPEQT